MDQFLVKARLGELRDILESGDKGFNEIQRLTKWSPKTVSKYLNLLTKNNDARCIVKGKYKTYSLSIESNYSLIWDLLDYQRKGALYVHNIATSYLEYGLEVDFARLPNDGSFNPSMEKLETAFMEGLVKAIGVKKNVPKLKDGKIVVAFQVDWKKFSDKMKKTNNRLLPYTPTKEQAKLAKELKNQRKTLEKAHSAK
jgi:hypothetical protein